MSAQYRELLELAGQQAECASRDKVDVPHALAAMLQLEDSYAGNLLRSMCEENTGELLKVIGDVYSGHKEKPDDMPLFSDIFREDEEVNPNSEPEWQQWVSNLNELVKDPARNKLIGRETELERTIQVLCRKDKNNPLHIGEAGVGKSALAYGLAALIEKGEVPDKLKGAVVYSLDAAGLLAGTSYRGEYEKRFKSVLNGIRDAKNCILYIDEIHTIVGAGRVEGGSMDGGNILKPYLEEGSIRFMGATTHDEYKRYVATQKAFARRFETIVIEEPSVSQCIEILKGLKGNYENFHKVKYTDEAIEFAVTASAKYITDRHLPDKAIDLIDEAGAYRVMHPSGMPIVDKRLISEMLAKICHVEILSDAKEDGLAALENLEDKIKSQIYGQDQAVRQVVEAVQLGHAGLIDDNKPLASLLFVGPTGVGKTELARTLAKELSVPLIRFDMSEYAEKHTVAKLIGAPAGYVGYEDGGLLTDAIRKQPQCVLLFDELEKAHSDIYNILLQVMDYAVLTDNRGQKADFRHVVFIMTTNAGAQAARQGALGFVKGSSSGQYMMKAVKQTFKPEFLNRLTDITIFNDIDRHMSELILDKKLRELQAKLMEKKVELELQPQAREWLLEKGFSAEYGGREVDRVLTAELKPMLTKAILFGNLKNGGKAVVGLEGDKLAI